MSSLNLPISLNLGLGPALNNVILLLTIVLFTAVLAIGMIAVVYVLAFRIKCTVLPVVGGGGDQLGIGKRKWQRFKWNKTKTAWKPLFPLFNRSEIEPFSVEYIYSGNNVFALELPDKKYIPLKINLHPKVGDKRHDFKTMLSEALPVPYYLSKWNEIELQQEETEFQKMSFWKENKHLIIGFFTVVLCLVLTGLTIWFVFRFAGGRYDAIVSQGEQLIDRIGQSMSIPGKEI